MPFRFKLEVLYKIRKEEEHQAELVVGRLTQEKYLLEKKVEEIVESRGEWSNRYTIEGQLNNSENTLFLIEQYIIALEKQKRQKEFEIETYEQKIIKAKEKLQEAYKARKQIEHLRDKQKELYKNEIKLREQRETDEMNTLRFIFQKNSEERILQ